MSKGDLKMTAVTHANTSGELARIVHRANKFKQIYVLEWLHEESGEWTAIEGSVWLRNAQRTMRDTRARWPKDKFRIWKYVPGPY